MKGLNWKINFFLLRKVRIFKSRPKQVRRKKVLIWNPNKKTNPHIITVGGSGECKKIEIITILVP